MNLQCSLSISLHSVVILQITLLILLLFSSFTCSMANPHPSAILPFLLPNYENSKSADGKKWSSCTILPTSTTFTKCNLKLSRCATQLCPKILRVIYMGSTSFRHQGSSFNYINTGGNETQSDGFRDGEVRRLTEMPLHLT